MLIFMAFIECEYLIQEHNEDTHTPEQNSCYPGCHCDTVNRDFVVKRFEWSVDRKSAIKRAFSKIM